MWGVHCTKLHTVRESQRELKIYIGQIVFALVIRGKGWVAYKYLHYWTLMYTQKKLAPLSHNTRPSLTLPTADPNTEPDYDNLSLMTSLCLGLYLPCTSLW